MRFTTITPEGVKRVSKRREKPEKGESLEKKLEQK